jgi:hypothetical protein
LLFFIPAVWQGSTKCSSLFSQILWDGCGKGSKKDSSMMACFVAGTGVQSRPDLRLAGLKMDMLASRRNENIYENKNILWNSHDRDGPTRESFQKPKPPTDCAAHAATIKQRANSQLN